MNKYIFIVNPVAGKGKGEKVLEQLRAALTLFDGDHELLITERTQHAEEISRSKNSPENIIISVGGDGTLHEVVNGLAPSFQSTIGVLPVGSGNDFARDLNLKKEMEPALKSILNPTTFLTIDVGYITAKENISGDELSSYFITSCGIGFDAYVAYFSNKNSYMKGLPLYISSVLRAMSSYKSFNVKADFDEQRVGGKKLLLAVGNGKSSGGGFLLNPDSEFDDGLLDVCVVEHLSKAQIMSKLPKAIKGKHKDIPETAFYKFKNAEISLNPAAYIHLDGEIFTCFADHIKINLLPKMLKIITG